MTSARSVIVNQRGETASFSCFRSAVEATLSYPLRLYLDILSQHESCCTLDSNRDLSMLHFSIVLLFPTWLCCRNFSLLVVLFNMIEMARALISIIP